MLPYAANTATQVNTLLDAGLVKLETDAALGIIYVPSTTSTGDNYFWLRYVDGAAP
jgi:hypothetical protein